MKPEDKAAFKTWWTWSKFNVSADMKKLQSQAWQAACAHRDTQPAVAVNEQMLNALKLYIAHAGDPECAIWRHVHSQINAAIAAAEAAKERKPNDPTK